jgi:hypothetical protein
LRRSTAALARLLTLAQLRAAFSETESGFFAAPL